nr:retrovirus-related Pol polyprotein from transposon TNT 1-94 [Tanacetum cinerariifolium]
SSNIATALVCLATNRTYNFSKMIFDDMVMNINNKTSKFLMYPRIVPLFDTMLVHQGEGSGMPTEPHHTPFPEADTSSHPTTSSIPLPSIPTAPIPPVTQPDQTPIRQYSRRARLAQSSAFPIVADEPASPVRDVSKGEACPTNSGFIAAQDRATIAKSSILPHDSAPRVTSSAAADGKKANDQEAEEGILYGCDQKQLGVKDEDFIPMGSKEETERLKRKGQNIEKEQVKKQKSSEEAPEIETSTEEFTEEKMKEMMQLVLVEDVYVQALQVKHPIINWKVHTEGRHGLVQGLPKLKFEKDHLCSACARGKGKKKPHKPKSEDANQEKLYLLHMDLCGPMCVASVNGKKYILVIFDDYSRVTWVKCLRSKDEASDFIIKFLKMIQVGISHETSVARFLQQNCVVKRRNSMLIKVAHPMLIYAKALLFLWAEAVATTCYTQNHSIIRIRHGKTPYELLHDKLPDLYVFGALCYMTNDSENLGKLQPKADIVISNEVEEENHDLNVAHMNNEPFFGILIPENYSKSSSLDVIPTVVHTAAPNSEHVNKWTKDHPLDNIIGELERPVSTRLQLHEQALFCYYDAFLTSVEPKTYKDALTQSCWIEAMQDELNEFEHLEVWELVPRPVNGYYFKMDLQVDRLDAIRIFLAFAAHINMIVYRMNVKMALLNGIPREEVYISQPDVFVDKDNLNHVYKLKKALYGLKQALHVEINKLGLRSFTPETLKQLADEAKE